VSFLQRAREAAEQAAQQARQATEQVRSNLNDPETQERMRHQMETASQQARDAASRTKRGIATIVDKIDPGLLADIVIKATALQEKSNASLRAKGSPYRISEIVITATIPPQVSFSIGRVGEIEEEVTGREISSTQIAAQEGLHEDVVISLDGTTVSTDDLEQAEKELAAEEELAAT
jgi:hypothetical protein